MRLLASLVLSVFFPPFLVLFGYMYHAMAMVSVAVLRCSNADRSRRCLSQQLYLACSCITYYCQQTTQTVASGTFLPGLTKDTFFAVILRLFDWRKTWMFLTRNHKPALPGLASGWNFSNQPQSFPFFFFHFQRCFIFTIFLWDGTHFTSYSWQPRYSRHSAIWQGDTRSHPWCDSHFFERNSTEMTLLMAHFWWVNQLFRLGHFQVRKLFSLVYPEVKCNYCPIKYSLLSPWIFQRLVYQRVFRNMTSY